MSHVAEAWDPVVRSPRKKPRLLQRGVVSTPKSPALITTTSPSEDHTYSAGPAVTGGVVAVSPDEAYGEGSDSDDR